MNSTSWASSNSSGQQKAGPDLEKEMDQRRKRLISNRDSARRSRARKQKLLDDLTAQVAELMKENRRFLTGINATVQNLMGVEAENTVLRAQMAELSHRLQSLEDITGILGGGFAVQHGMAELSGFSGGGGFWNCSSLPIVTAAAPPADPGFLY